MRTESTARTLLRSGWFATGAALFVLGSGPLLFCIAREQVDSAYAASRPNPIGFGLLAGLTFWPAILLMIVGAARVWKGRGRP